MHHRDDDAGEHGDLDRFAPAQVHLHVYLVRAGVRGLERHGQSLRRARSDGPKVGVARKLRMLRLEIFVEAIHRVEPAHVLKRAIPRRHEPRRDRLKVHDSLLEPQLGLTRVRGAPHGTRRAPADDVHDERREIFLRQGRTHSPRRGPRDPHRLHAVPRHGTPRRMHAVRAPGRDAPLVLGRVHVRVRDDQRLRHGILPIFRREPKFERRRVQVELHGDDVGEHVEGVARGSVAVDGVPHGGLEVPVHAIDAERDAKVRGFTGRDNLRRRRRVLQLQLTRGVHVDQHRLIVFVGHGEELEVIAEHRHLPKVQHARSDLELRQLLRYENPGALLHLLGGARHSLKVGDDAQLEQLVILRQALCPVLRPEPPLGHVRVQPQGLHRVRQRRPVIHQPAPVHEPERRRIRGVNPRRLCAPPPVGPNVIDVAGAVSLPRGRLLQRERLAETPVERVVRVPTRVSLKRRGNRVQVLPPGSRPRNRRLSHLLRADKLTRPLEILRHRHGPAGERRLLRDEIGEPLDAHRPLRHHLAARGHRLDGEILDVSAQVFGLVPDDDADALPRQNLTARRLRLEEGGPVDDVVHGRLLAHVLDHHDVVAHVMAGDRPKVQRRGLNVQRARDRLCRDRKEAPRLGHAGEGDDPEARERLCVSVDLPRHRLKPLGGRRQLRRHGDRYPPPLVRLQYPRPRLDDQGTVVQLTAPRTSPRPGLPAVHGVDGTL